MELTEFGHMIGHKSRVGILLALMGGKALPAGELAYRAGVSNQTASSHLNALKKSGMIRMRKCGRFRYYEIASKKIANILEGLSAEMPGTVTLSSKWSIPPNLRKARFCYDHLAGELGVSISQKLVQIGALSLEGDCFALPRNEHPIYREIGINLADVTSKRRKISPRCIDWSERVPHVAGSLGSAIASQLLEQKLIFRSRDDRSVIISDRGSSFFQKTLGLCIA